MSTPTMAKKLVHWALETIGSPSLSSLKLPAHQEEDSTTESTEENNTATLQYVNSQLIAHGFTHGPGLSLDGAGKDDAEKVLKCLVAMLGQRMDDMTRTEDLSTKIRTLSYDHERLQSMYRTSTEKTANAERETNVHKARLASTTRTLTTTASSLKSSQAELQRTRTALQSLRATHQAEIKKVEKEKDKLLEKVTKLSEHQYVTRVAGIRYANETALNHYGVSSLGPTPSGPSSSTSGPPAVTGTGDFLEITLEESLRHRQELADENRALKTLLLRIANEIQNVEFQARCAVADLLTVKEKELGKLDDVNEPELLTSVSLFPLSPPVPTTASAVVVSLLTSLRDSLHSLADPEGRVMIDDSLSATTLTSNRKPTVDNAAMGESNGFTQLSKQINLKDRERELEKSQHQTEVRKLNGEIERLRSELEQAKTQASTYAAQIQLTDLSKQVEQMQRPWAIYGAQPSTAAPPTITRPDATPMDIDSAPPQTEPTSKRPSTSSSKRAVNNLFHSDPQPIAGPSTVPRPTDDDDVFAHLPPPSPALSYLDEPQTRSPAKPVEVAVRRSPRKPKPTSPLRIPPRAGSKRKASDTVSPDAAKAKKAKTELPKKDSVSESVRGFRAGVGAVSSPRGKQRSKTVEKPAKTMGATTKAKGKERAPAKPVNAAQKAKLPVKKGKASVVEEVEAGPSSGLPPLNTAPSAPSLPTFVLPPPSPASRLPSMQIPSEAGPSTNSNHARDDDPFMTSAPTAHVPSAPTSSLPTSQQVNQPIPETSTAAASSEPSIPPVPSTPSRRVFPNNTGRPFAPHMVHAYSPVRPSPLSRILKLADSPDSPDEPPIPKLGTLMEVDEPEDLLYGLDEDSDEDMDVQLSPTPARRRLSLAEELGLSDDDADFDTDDDEASDADEVESLIRGKGKGRATGTKSVGTKPSTKPRSRVSPSPSRARRDKLSGSKGKAKAKAKPAPPAKPKPVSPAKPTVSKAKEKENRRRSPRIRTKLSSAQVKTRSSASTSVVEAETVKPNLRRSKVIEGGIKKTRSTTRAAVSKNVVTSAAPPLELEDLEPAGPQSKSEVKLKGRSRGGPRRVPIESADAAPVAPAWRG